MRKINKLINQMEEMLANKKETCSPYKYSENLSTKVKLALKDLDDNHNNTIAVEVIRRNINNLDKKAIFYRGSNITYDEMFTKVYEYACSLKALGYTKGSEIPVCVENIPEFSYLFLACNLIGAKIHVVGNWFNKDYLKKILNETNSKFIFISDKEYPDIKDVIEESNIEKIVMFSLADSLPKNKEGQNYNPYSEIDNQFYKIRNRINEHRKTSKKIIFNALTFLSEGVDYQGNLVADCTLNDPATITYTSGTTDPGCPKGCIHSNRTYISLSRFKESDVSGMPSMRNLTVLGHIPTYTHMQLSCGYIDTFYEKCTLALEPFYSVESFPYALVINKPNYVPAANGAWDHLCKLLNYDPRWKHVNMPYLMIPTVTGEAASIGEEKFYNITSRKHKFGTSKLPFPLAPVTFSVGGGTTESSGILVTLYKALQEKKPSVLLKNESLGLMPHQFAELKVLDENGDYCKQGEPGLLVGKSPCDMIGYTDPKFNEHIYKIDKYGKQWLNLGTYAYVSDNQGRIKMKGRPFSYIYSNNGTKIPMFIIEDAINKDTKNIKSCSLVIVDGAYICHIEFQPVSRLPQKSILSSCASRLSNVIPSDILDKIYFRVRTFTEGYPIAPSGKRDRDALRTEGINDKCLPLNEYLVKEKGKVLSKKN